MKKEISVYKAHINEFTGAVQTVKEHCEATAALSAAICVAAFVLTFPSASARANTLLTYKKCPLFESQGRQRKIKKSPTKY